MAEHCNHLRYRDPTPATAATQHYIQYPCFSEEFMANITTTEPSRLTDDPCYQTLCNLETQAAAYDSI